jgi:hypothetical protein
LEREDDTVFQQQDSKIGNSRSIGLTEPLSYLKRYPYLSPDFAVLEMAATA